MSKGLSGGGFDLTAQALALSRVGDLGKGYFPPSNPLVHLAPSGFGWGRAFDYNQSHNLQNVPHGNEAFTYAQLRNLARNCDLVNDCIQTVIDRITSVSGFVVDVGGDPKKPSKQAQAITLAMERPDGIRDLYDFLGVAYRDMLEIDAATAWIDRSGVRPLARNVDGSTICVRINEQGSPYMLTQIINGGPAHDYQLNEMIWMPRNRRSDTIWGFSPVEQAARFISLALHRVERQISFFSDGDIPSMLIEAPESWTPEQIRLMQANWHAMLAGISGKDVARWMPPGSKATVYDRDPSKGEFDEWVARVLCHFFSIPPTAFVKEVNRATAQTTQDSSMAEGHKANLRWSSNFLTSIISAMFGPGYKWRWNLDADPSADMTANLVISGKLKNSALIRLGYDPEDIAPDAPAEPADGTTPKDANQPHPDDDNKVNTKQENADASHVHSVLNADMDVLSDAGTALDNLLQDYLDDLREEAVKSGIEAFKTNAIFDLTDSPAFAIKATTHLTSAFGEGVDGAARDLKASDLVNDAAEWARERSAWLVGMKRNADGDLIPNPDSKYAISDVCRANIRATIAQGLEEGWNDAQVQEKIAADNSFTPLRANKIASFETANAQEEGKLKVFAKTGTLATTWSDFDGCQVCQTNAAAGAVEIGKLFPSGHTHAPAHPHCRCSNLPAEVNE